MARVAVEQSLTPVSQMLRANGHEVVEIGNEQQAVDAFVITGQDANMMGMSDISTGAPVINAEGMTTQEIFHAVTERLSGPKHR